MTGMDVHSLGGVFCSSHSRTFSSSEESLLDSWIECVVNKSVV
jgi:hypothetical protein